MRNGQINTENGVLYYEIKNGKATVTGFQGFCVRLRLPGQIEGYPVAVIDRKAFLGQKGLYGITLPEETEEIGDWAFANCSSLTEIFLPGREIRFGRAVFKNCTKLERIVTEDFRSGKTALPGSEPELLAAAVTLLDAYYLLDLSAAGSREWMGKWDAKLLSVLRTPDQEGYISQSVYGEEDYIGTDLEEYVSARRKEKVRLAFLRLLHPRNLEPALKAELEAYLRSLTKGGEGEESWRVLLEEHGSDRAYYNLFAELGCVTEENLDAILADIGDNCPEMKAFFLQKREEQREEGDFFREFEL